MQDALSKTTLCDGTMPNLYSTKKGQILSKTMLKVSGIENKNLNQDSADKHLTYSFEGIKNFQAAK